MSVRGVNSDTGHSSHSEVHLRETYVAANKPMISLSVQTLGPANDARRSHGDKVKPLHVLSGMQSIESARLAYIASLFAKSGSAYRAVLPIR